MAHPVSVTLDVEDLRPSPDLPERAPLMTNRVLDLFADAGVRASVYVVADLAERHPEIVRRAAAEGHEIGLHGHEHVPLPVVGESAFADATRCARSLLQDLSGQPVAGYRAPMMSLVPGSSWAVPMLSDLGFAYSSSTLPAPSPLYGWPGLPRRPFRWSSGLIELPCPLLRVSMLDLPYLGGTYLRVLPDFVRRHGQRRAGSEEVLWTYSHPWEFDTDEPYHVHEHIGAVASRVAWLRRGRMEDRVRRLLSEPTAPPLVERVEALVVGSLPVVDYAQPSVLGRAARFANGRLRSD